MTAMMTKPFLYLGILLSAGLLQAAWAISPHASTSAMEKKGVGTMQSESPQSMPQYSAEELLQRLLHFIEGLQQRSDINRDNLESSMGVQLQLDPRRAGNYRYHGVVAEGWEYWLNMRMHADGYYGLRVETSMQSYSQILQPCTFALDTFSEEMQTLDYEADRFPRNHIRFHKLFFAVETSVYMGGDSSDDKRLCIGTMVIESGELAND